MNILINLLRDLSRLGAVFIVFLLALAGLLFTAILIFFGGSSVDGWKTYEGIDEESVSMESIEKIQNSSSYEDIIETMNIGWGFQDGKFRLATQFIPLGKSFILSRENFRTDPYRLEIRSRLTSHEIKAIRFSEALIRLSGGRKIDLFDTTVTCYTEHHGHFTDAEIRRFVQDRRIEVSRRYIPVAPSLNREAPAAFTIQDDYLEVTFEKLDINFETVENFDLEMTLEFYYNTAEEGVTEKLVKTYRRRER
jgi:hypothetical protein